MVLKWYVQARAHIPVLHADTWFRARFRQFALQIALNRPSANRSKKFGVFQAG
jgi:hypothetical protein